MLHFWSEDVWGGGIRGSFCNRYLSYCPQAPQTKSPSEEIITQGGHINSNPMLWGLAPPYLPLPHLFQPLCCRGATLYLVHVWAVPVATHEGCVCVCAHVYMCVHSLPHLHITLPFFLPFFRSLSLWLCRSPEGYTCNFSHQHSFRIASKDCVFYHVFVCIWLCIWIESALRASTDSLATVNGAAGLGLCQM